MGWRRAFVICAAVAALVAPASSQAVPASAPDPAVEAWRSWPFEASCYSRFDPVQVFSGPADAEFGSTPAEAALVQIAATQAFPPLPDSGWRRVTETETEAVFVHGALSSPFGPLWVFLEQTDGTWKWSGSGNCAPRTTLHGLLAATWALDPEQPPPGPKTRRLSIYLSAAGCSSGMSPNDRARKPIFRQFGKRLVMIVLVEPLPPGFYTCQGVVSPPLKVKLPTRLGARTIFDGGSFPPQPVSIQAAGASRSAFLRQ
jgi:hypothetical protein